MRRLLLGSVGFFMVATGGFANPNVIGFWRFEEGGDGFLSSTPPGNSLKGLGIEETPPASVPVGTATGAVPFPEKIPGTGEENRGAARLVRDKFQVFRVGEMHNFEESPFTIEAFIRLKSLPKVGSAVIASRGGGHEGDFAWQLLVTGEESTHGPGELLFQFSTTGSSGNGLETLKPGFQIELDQPYYIALAFDPENPGEDGAQLCLVKLPDAKAAAEWVGLSRSRTGIYSSNAFLTIGANNRPGMGGFDCWDGDIDEVRISEGMLSSDQLLIHSR